MSNKTVYGRVAPLSYTSAEWAAFETEGDVILNYGEVGFDKTVGKYKVGDGVNTWSSLSFLPISSLSAASSGTDLSYVTTGEKNSWNNKSDTDSHTNGTLSTGTKLFVIGTATTPASSGTTSVDTRANTNVYIDTSNGLTATSFTATSSRNRKNNIEPTTLNACDLINSINVVNFTYKEDAENIPHIGFIAEDTDPLLSTPSREHMDMVNSIGVLLKAVQELSAKNKQLEERLNSLQGK